MGSWVLHAAGLLIEELSRAQVQTLGRGCRQLSNKVNPGSPPPGAVPDRHGHWWELGDRARHIDSASRGDQTQEVSFSGRRDAPPAPVKYKLGRVTSAEGGDRALLLPDHVEVRGKIDEPISISASDGPPGLPISAKNSQLNNMSATTMPRRGTIRAPIRCIDEKLARAHHAVAQRRLRSYSSEYFCLMVPCCRVTLGPATHNEMPATSTSQWPAYVSALVLGARVDGEILPRGRPSQHQQSREHPGKFGFSPAEPKARPANSKNDDRVKWQTDTGETVLLDFHNGPTSRGPGGSDQDIYNLLSYLDEHWVRKARRFPATWSLLWVETMDTELVISELRGDGVEDICPVCSAPLIFGALEDKDKDSCDHESDEDSDGESSSKSKSSAAASSSTSDSSAAASKDDDLPATRPVAETKSQMQRRATRAVQKLLRSSTMSILKANSASRLAASNKRDNSCDGTESDHENDPQRCSTMHNNSFRVSISMGPRNSSRVSTQDSHREFGGSLTGSALYKQASFQAAGDASLEGMPRLTESFLAERFQGSLSVPNTEPNTDSRPSRVSEGPRGGEIAAWESGSLPCARCHTTSEPTWHALICPRLDARHSYFLPVCAECREAIEHVFAQRRWQATQISNSEDPSSQGSDGTGRRASVPINSESPSIDLQSRPASGATNSHVLLPSDRELCVAIELEMRLSIQDVAPSRHQLILEELRDEIHRVLMVPLCQIFVLQDDSSRKGIFQIGILHPELLPMSEETRCHVEQKKKKKSRKGNDPQPPPTAPSHAAGSLLSLMVKEDVAERRTEAASIATDLGKVWDRLLAIYHGDSGEYRFFCTNAFPLLRSKLRDGGGLMWRSGIVVSLATRKDLIQTMHDSKEVGSDDEGSGDDSDMDDLLDMEPESPTAKHAESRRPSTFGGRRRSSSSSTVGETPGINARRQSSGRLMMKGVLEGLATSTNLSDPSTSAGSPSPQHGRAPRRAGQEQQASALDLDARVESQLRPAGLELKSSSVFQHGHTEIDVAKAGRSSHPQAEREWALEAEKLGLLPPRSEVKHMHMPFLHFLAWDGNSDKLKSALETASTTSINAGDRCGRTPLHLAAARSKADVVRLLISAAEPTGPVKLEEKDVQGRTPLHYSAYRGDVSIVACFLRTLQIKSLDAMEVSTGDTSVLIAARYKHEEALKSLLFAFASPDISNKRGLTALHVAAAIGTVQCCQLLLHAGAAVEPRDALDRTPWEWAAIYKYSEVMDFLANAGSTVGRDHQSSWVQSPPVASPKVAVRKARPHQGTRQSPRMLQPTWTTSLTAPNQKMRPLTTPSPRTRSLASPRLRSTPLATPRSIEGSTPTASSEVTALPMVLATPRSQSKTRAQTAPTTPAGGQRRGSSRGPAVHSVRDELREALLEGIIPKDEAKIAMPDGWAGNVGSLAVRWRSWAHAAFAPTKESAPSPLSMRHSELESSEPTREEVAKECQTLGGFFCTVCWEYVLEGHPCGAGHLPLGRNIKQS